MEEVKVQDGDVLLVFFGYSCQAEASFFTFSSIFFA